MAGRTKAADAPSPGPTPEALLSRWRDARDPDSLGALFDAAAPGLFRLALSLEPDAAAAEDALQETFLAAAAAAHRWDPSRPVIPWLAGILRHRVQEGRRARRRTPDPTRLPPPPPPDDPALLAETAEERERLRAAMEALPEPYRGVALLRWRYGLDPAEIADVRGQPPGTVWSLLHRAAKRLRAEVGALPALVLAFRPERGLDGVKRALLRRAATGAAAAAGAASSSTAAAAALETGGILMTAKTGVAAAATLVLVAAGSWVLLRPGPAPAPGDGEAATSRNDAGAPVVPADPSPRPPEAVPPGAPADPLPPPVDLEACDRDLDLFGVVVDPEGRPVPGATVESFRRPAEMLYDLPPELRSSREAGPSTRTARDGTFVLRLERGARVHLRVDAPPFAETTLQHRPAGARLRVVLRPGTTLRLTVRDDAGAPVAGVPVQLHRPAELPLPLIDRRTVTDPQGRCTFHRLTAGPAALGVDHPALGLPEPRGVRIAEAGEQTLEVVLPRGRVVAGEVRDASSGAPIPGAVVRFDPMTAPRGTTDPEGAFSVAGWSGGPEDALHIGAAGFATARVPVPEEGPVVARLSPATVVRGRVQDAHGRPLPGARALLTRTPTGALALSGEDGGFRLAGDLGGRFPILAVSAPGHGSAFRPLRRGDAPEVDLGDIRLPAGRTIHGTVVDVAGRAIEDAPVIAEPDTREYVLPRELREVAWTDDLGRFRFIDRSPGRWRVAVLPDGPAGPVEVVIDVPEGVDPPAVILRPAASRDVAVTVVDGSGAPIEGAVAGVRSAGRESGRLQRTDAAGRAVLRGVAREAAEVRVADPRPDARFLPETVPLPADADALRVALARPAAGISGRAVGPDGEPVPGAWLFARPFGTPAADPLGGAMTGRDGSFRLDLPAGTRVDIVIDAQAATMSRSPYRGEVAAVEAPAGDVLLRARRVTADGSLRVLVLDPDGNAVPRAPLYVFGAGPPRTGLTGDDGVFAVEGLTGDPLDVQLVHQEEDPKWAEWVPPPTTRVDDGRGRLELRIRRGRILRGRVVDGAGAAVPGGLCIASYGDGTRTQGVIDGEGRFALPVLPDRIVDELLTGQWDAAGTEVARASLADVPPDAVDVVLRYP